MIKFLKVKGIYKTPNGAPAFDEATRKFLDNFGTICANKGFVWGIVIGIGMVGGCYGSWHLGKFIGGKIKDKIEYRKNKKNEEAK